jgi:hypothetical protein
MSAWRGVLLAVLVAADLWSLVTLFNAITGGKGHGAVFWTAVALIAVATVALIWWTVRVARRIARASWR